MTASIDKENPGSIMLVDDDYYIRQFLKMLLLHNGFSVIEAEDGKQGLELLQLNTVKLVVLDSNMPGMDGLQFLEVLRNEMKSDIPVISLSSMGNQISEQDLINAGATTVVSKSVEPEMILQQINHVIEIG